MDKWMKFLEGIMLSPDTGADGGESGGTSFIEGASDGSSVEESTETPDIEETTTEEGPPKILGQANKKNKEREDLHGYKTLDDYIAAIDSFKGKTFIPGEDATDEEISAYYESLGVPKEPSGYEGIENDIAAKALELKLTKDQAAAVNQLVADKRSELYKDVKATALQTEKLLKAEWGKDYPARIDNMKRAMEIITNGVPEFKEVLSKTKASNMPEMVKGLEYIGSLFSEDGLPLGKEAGGNIDDQEAKLRRMYPSMF